MEFNTEFKCTIKDKYELIIKPDCPQHFDDNTDCVRIDNTRNRVSPDGYSYLVKDELVLEKEQVPMLIKMLQTIS